MSRKRTTDKDTPETSAAVADPPAAEEVNGQTFAERVGQRKWASAPDPFGIATDNVVGVRLFESKRDRQMTIKFEEKPSQAVIDRLNVAGYRWRPSDRIWAHLIRYEAEWLYQARWFEIGEMSRDGKQWRNFFEMTLERGKEP